MSWVNERTLQDEGITVSAGHPRAGDVQLYEVPGGDAAVLRWRQLLSKVPARAAVGKPFIGNFRVFDLGGS